MQDISLFKKNILQFINTQNIKKSEFYRKTGITRGVLDHSSGLSEDNVTKFIASYPNVNIEWLLTGNGNMFIDSNNELSQCISHESDLGVPYYDVDFSGGFNAIFNNQNLLPDHNIVFAPFKDAQLWCNVTGNSMAEKINHGDIIALKELTNWEENVLFGEIYAVVTDHLRTIKIIRKSNNEDNYRLVPINTNEFDENEVKKTSILKVFTVLGAIKKFF